MCTVVNPTGMCIRPTWSNTCLIYVVPLPTAIPPFFLQTEKQMSAIAGQHFAEFY